MATSLAASEAVWSFWFGGRVSDSFRSLWFPAEGAAAQASADGEVEARFGATLQAARAGELESWRGSPVPCVCLILVLDQFSRHVHRHRRSDPQQQAACDAQALEVCEQLLSCGWERRLSVAEHVFALFPLRHSPSVARLQRALAQVDARCVVEETHGQLLARFRRATLRRLQDLQGRQWLPGDELLEHAAFEADETRLLRDPLALAVAEFMRRHSPIHPSTPGPQEDPPPLRAAVSLSGGVDSMVLCTILARLGRDARPPWRCAALHIDYGNRPESSAEAAYVRAWCEQHGVEFRVRSITECSRSISDREAYERESRRIRYHFYALAMAQMPHVRGICVGHHAGDVAENVLTNLLKGSCLLSISGMSERSTVSGVPVWRPLLSFDKCAILAFAHTYGVPYFRDTTPDWSTRGKLRRQLLPALEGVFGEGILHTLSRCGLEADSLAQMVHGTLLGPFHAAAVRSAAGAWFDAQPWLSQPVLFWREALKALCHELGTGLVKEKAVGELLLRLRRPRARDGWIPLKRDNRAYIQGTRVAVFATEMFPKMPHAPPGTPVALGTCVAFGPWRVETAAVAESLRSVAASGEPVTLWQLLSGSVAYGLPLPDGGPGLRVAEAPRLPAFKGMQRRLRCALPLLVSGADRDGTEEDAGAQSSEDEEEEEEEAGAPRRRPTFRVRAWSEAELDAPQCVLVTLTFTREKRSAGEGQGGVTDEP